MAGDEDGNYISAKEGECRMPLTLAEVGEENIIKRIGGKQEVKAHLENLGFVVGGTVTVISAIGGNVIVNVKDSRIAVSKEMAQKIMI
ncbi:MAG: ferrous iron transport protein A [Lachnospiraceae bacterium]|nr:ferrous iron transport protein A [Lachnospiraceae bacterium]